MGVKFEDMDILDALGKIMELHTKHYKDDFDLDKELLAKLAVQQLIIQMLEGKMKQEKYGDRL